jgi:shikimate kinase
MNSRLILVGFMGVGKSTIGKDLADKLQLPFYDTDLLIEKKLQKTIINIFKEDGESYFREKEYEVISELLKKEKFVISTGGGLPTHNLLAEKLKENGTVIWLCKSIDKIIRYIKTDKTRPKSSLNYKDLRKLYSQRMPFYKKADKKIVVNNETEQIVERIIGYISELEA